VLSHVDLLFEFNRQSNFFLSCESLKGFELAVQGLDLLSHALTVLLRK
jgi:hypothetical protein